MVRVDALLERSDGALDDEPFRLSVNFLADVVFAWNRKKEVWRSTKEGRVRIERGRAKRSRLAARTKERVREKGEGRGAGGAASDAAPTYLEASVPGARRA